VPRTYQIIARRPFVKPTLFSPFVFLSVAGRNFGRLDLTKEERTFSRLLIESNDNTKPGTRIIIHDILHLLNLNFVLPSLSSLVSILSVASLNKRLQDGQSILRRLGAMGEDDFCMCLDHECRASTNM
jgi:hypothetical protein